MVQQYEAKYANEYLMVHYPNNLQWKRVRLGPLPNVELAKMYEVTLRWADAIIKENNDIIIAEMKLVNQLAGVSQLELYKQLFVKTPEFSDYWGNHIILRLVVPYLEQETKDMCEQKGIEYVLFTPNWYTRA